MKNYNLMKVLLFTGLSVVLFLFNVNVFEKEVWAVLPLTQITESEYYGRQQLVEMDKGEVLVKLYDRFVTAIQNVETTINIYDIGEPLTVEEVDLVYQIYRNDYPQHFWRKNEYSYSYYPSTGSVVYITPKYSLKGEELEKAKIEYEKSIEEILSQVNGDMSEFERELIIHDILADKVEFDMNGLYAHEAYGAIVDDKAVCEGYARAFQDLLYRVGILSTTVTGKGNDTDHAWNMVRIDGKFYFVDLTWNDQPSVTYHEYFNLPLKNMSIDHSLDKLIDMPEFNSLEYNYHNIMGGWLEGLTVEGIVREMKDDLKAEVYMGLDIDIEKLGQWLGNNIGSIASECGVTGQFSYSYRRMNRECVITINPKSGTREEISVTGVGLNLTSYEMHDIGEKVKLEAVIYPEKATNKNITYKSENTNVATVDKYTGVVKAIGEGKTNIIVVTEDGLKTEKCQITVNLQKELVGNLLINGKDDAQVIDIDDPIRFEVLAVGGSAEYTYQYKMYNFSTGKWYTIKKFTEDSQFVYSDLKEGKYRFVVQVKDSLGTQKDTNKIDIVVNSDELVGELKINDSVENSSACIGDVIEISINARGGSGQYTYRYMIYDFSTQKWSVIKGFSTTKKISYKFDSLSKKRFVVQVKDSLGKTVDSNKITVSVTESKLMGELQVKGLTSDTTIGAGKSVELNVKGIGGSGDYQYQYKVYVASLNKWITLKKYSTENTFVWTPSTIGKHRLVVQVKDKLGNVVDSNKITLNIN